MKRFFTKTTSMALAFIVLFVTTSFSVDMHFCANKLFDVSVFNKVESCTATPKEISLKNNEDSCCITKTFVKVGNDDLQNAFYEFNSESFVFLSNFLHSNTSFFKGFKKQNSSFLKYIPPLLSKDIFKLHQTFLI